MRRIEISFLERSEEVKELENTKNKLAKELEVTRKGYLQKNKKKERLDLETAIKNSLKTNSNRHDIISQELSGTAIPDWGGNIYGSNEIRPATYADKSKGSRRQNHNTVA